MSMYGMMFGQNALAPLILWALGWDEGDVPRFRDAFLADGKIAIYTRMGAGNAECWEDGADDCDCYQCGGVARLQAHAEYSYAEEDDFDCTYKTFWFKIPEFHAEVLGPIAAEGEFKPDKRWADKLAALESGEEPVPDAAADLVRRIVESFETLTGGE